MKRKIAVKLRPRDKRKPRQVAQQDETISIVNEPHPTDVKEEPISFQFPPAVQTPTEENHEQLNFIHSDNDVKTEDDTTDIFLHPKPVEIPMDIGPVEVVEQKYVDEEEGEEDSPSKSNQATATSTFDPLPTKAISTSRNYPCRLCEVYVSFLNKRSLQLHMLTKHSSGVIHCIACQNHFDSIHTFRSKKHMVTCVKNMGFEKAKKNRELLKFNFTPAELKKAMEGKQCSFEGCDSKEHFDTWEGRQVHILEGHLDVKVHPYLNAPSCRKCPSTQNQDDDDGGVVEDYAPVPSKTSLRLPSMSQSSTATITQASSSTSTNLSRTDSHTSFISERETQPGRNPKATFTASSREANEGRRMAKKSTIPLETESSSSVPPVLPLRLPSITPNVPLQPPVVTSTQTLPLRLPSALVYPTRISTTRAESIKGLQMALPPDTLQDTLLPDFFSKFNTTGIPRFNITRIPIPPKCPKNAPPHARGSSRRGRATIRPNLNAARSSRKASEETKEPEPVREPIDYVAIVNNACKLLADDTEIGETPFEGKTSVDGTHRPLVIKLKSWEMMEMFRSFIRVHYCAGTASFGAALIYRPTDKIYKDASRMDAIEFEEFTSWKVKPCQENELLSELVHGGKTRCEKPYTLKELRLESVERQSKPESFKDAEERFFKNIGHQECRWVHHDSFFIETWCEWNYRQIVTDLSDPFRFIPINTTLFGGKITPGFQIPLVTIGLQNLIVPVQMPDSNFGELIHLHEGGPIYWYIVPPCAAETFEALLSYNLVEEFAKCPAFLRHKEHFVHPELLEDRCIYFSRVVQEECSDLVITPGTYYWGFSESYACIESLKFHNRHTFPYFMSGRYYCKCTDKDVKFYRRDPVVKDYVEEERYENYLKNQEKNDCNQWYKLRGFIKCDEALTGLSLSGAGLIRDCMSMET